MPSRNILILILISLLTSCASYDRSQGVTNNWRDPSTPVPVIGKSTQSEIIQALGPPSQIIALQNQTVFYYLKERRLGKGAILLIYNYLQENVTYDRAIYFFDENGILVNFGLSNEKIALPEK